MASTLLRRLPLVCALVGLTALHGCGAADRLPETWPPRVGHAYPDLELRDCDGERVELSSFRGKVLLVEPIGMPCPGCVALCGGHRRGAFAGVAPQAGLPSLAEMFPRFTGGFDLDDERITVVQLLLFDTDMGTPEPDDARRWAEHFGTGGNHVVLVGNDALREVTHAMIPGYQLVDRDFVLRYDSTGHHPEHDLYRELLPAVGAMLRDSAAPR